MRKLAEAIVAPGSAVELVLGTRFWSRALLYFTVARQEFDPLEPRPSYFQPQNGSEMTPSVIQALRNQHPTSSRFLLSSLIVLFSCPRSSIPSSQKAKGEARMTARQTKFISDSPSQANSVPHLSTIGINTFQFILPTIVSSRLIQIVLSCLQTLL